MDKDAIDYLKTIVVQFAGPLGAFVVAKTIHDMGYDAESMPDDMMRELIKKTMERAIFDPEKREEAERTALKEFGL